MVSQPAIRQIGEPVPRALRLLMHLRVEPAVAWAAAAALLLAALSLRLDLGDAIHDAPFLTFLPAVALAALLGGWVVGLTATFGAVVLVWTVFLRVPGAAAVPTSADLASVAVFLALAVPTAFGMAALRTSLHLLLSTHEAVTRALADARDDEATRVRQLATALDLLRRRVRDSEASERVARLAAALDPDTTADLAGAVTHLGAAVGPAGLRVYAETAGAAAAGGIPPIVADLMLDAAARTQSGGFVRLALTRSAAATVTWTSEDDGVAPDPEDAAEIELRLLVNRAGGTLARVLNGTTRTVVSVPV